MGGIGLRVVGVLALLVGCGSVSDSQPAIDAGIDADATIDPELTGIVTVVTQSALFGDAVGAQAGNIDIVSNLPDNTVLETARTDASGIATIEVYPGGSVTAIYKHTVDVGSDLITWIGVKPGDILTFGNRSPATAGQVNTSVGAQTYSWPALANTSQYRVWTACNDGLSSLPPSTTLTTSEFAVCHRNPMTVLYGAFDAGNALIGFGVRANVVFASGATVALGGWSSPAAAAVNVTGLPPSVTSVSGGFRAVIDDRSDFVASGTYGGTPTGGAFTASVALAQVGLRTLGALSLLRTGHRSIQVLDAIALGTLTQTVAAPALPPWGQGSTIASAGVGMASWFVVPDASSVHDGQIVHLRWSYMRAGTPSSSQWHIIVPPDQTSVVLPTLPAALSGSRPAPEDSLSASTRVFEIPAVTGYDMLRAKPSASVMCLECAARSAEFQRVVFTQL
jgi:hypothetical protein